MINVWVPPEPPPHEITIDRIRNLCTRCGWVEACDYLRKLEESRLIAERRYEELQAAYAALKERHEPTVARRLYEGECGKPGWDSDG